MTGGFLRNVREALARRSCVASSTALKADPLWGEADRCQVGRGRRAAGRFRLWARRPKRPPKVLGVAGGSASLYDNLGDHPGRRLANRCALETRSSARVRTGSRIC